ncbi:hypothetical protein [Botrimarina mediterranea]|uniref:Outer membrane protein beta-barrel domain-containing protein n=1 Tax=Botrimarina mediterranea TaxID=2528022 RepID=A0A518KED7_9BACT|nr:hypothetical protein [Botrimarina mediterranea]QDV76152.1 hypothetical protein Spa11_43770 [Botrimarina mediterranea]QDV80749.1 hypothetical protein K2D_43790 [Planctomycetes bacterium K2D]
MRSLALLLSATAASLGCSGSRWARSDPHYAEKYPVHTDNPVRVVKQAVDARHVEGSGGWYASAHGSDDPAAGEGRLGVFRYPEGYGGTVETRGGLIGVLAEGGGVGGGFELGARVQTPTRLAPFAGVSGFVAVDEGALQDEYQWNDPNSDPVIIETGFAAGIAPEVGVHYWLNADWRLTGSVSHTLADFEGPGSANYTAVGVSLAHVTSLGANRTSRPHAAPCADTVIDVSVEAPPLPQSPLTSSFDNNPPRTNPYAELLAPGNANP